MLNDRNGNLLRLTDQTPDQSLIHRNGIGMTFKSEEYEIVFKIGFDLAKEEIKIW